MKMLTIVAAAAAAMMFAGCSDKQEAAPKTDKPVAAAADKAKGEAQKAQAAAKGAADAAKAAVPAPAKK